MARTSYAQEAWDHTPVCDDLDALMDLLGEVQRRNECGSPLFTAIGRVRMAMCDAQAVAETECRWVGTSDGS